jgi:C-terminal processing protease CtpA/Prc
MISVAMTPRTSKFAIIRQILLAIVTGCSTPACASAVPGTIGAALGQQPDHRVFIRSAPPGQGADKAGLLVDDEVVALDGKPVLGMTPDDIRRAVRGDVGTTLVVTILRYSRDAQPEKRDIKVTRTPLLADKPK